MRAVRWTPLGVATAARLFAYIERENPRAAQELSVEIAARTEMLGRFPFIGRVGYDATTRELIIRRNFIVVYRVWPDSVEVLQVWHAAQRRPTRA